MTMTSKTATVRLVIKFKRDADGEIEDVAVDTTGLEEDEVIALGSHLLDSLDDNDFIDDSAVDNDVEVLSQPGKKRVRITNEDN